MDAAIPEQYMLLADDTVLLVMLYVLLGCRTLYDVFCNVRDDEAEHVKTMKACQDYSIVDEMTQRREEKRPKPVGSPEAGKAT